MLQCKLIYLQFSRDYESNNFVLVNRNATLHGRFGDKGRQLLIIIQSMGAVWYGYQSQVGSLASSTSQFVEITIVRALN